MPNTTSTTAGGVCQVSSTLYNAARLANLTILERHSHSHEVTYVPKGRDAAVVYGEKDLKIRNDREGAVLIKSYFAADSITFKILVNPCNFCPVLL